MTVLAYDELLKERDELLCKIEDLEWENKGIDEWRTIAATAIYDNRMLREEIKRLKGIQDEVDYY